MVAILWEDARENSMSRGVSKLTCNYSNCGIRILACIPPPVEYNKTTLSHSIVHTMQYYKVLAVTNGIEREVPQSSI